MAEDPPEFAVRGDRFSGGPARGFLSSMETDVHLFTADLAVDRAHVIMLGAQSILDEEEVAAILVGLDAIEEAGFDELPAAEDIHEAIETDLIDRVGPVGGKLHTARSRNDEVATCIRYHLREDMLELVSSLLALRDALADQAHEHVETVMPGYTHLQPAQPTTVAHWAISYERSLARDVDRVFDAYNRINRSPLGAAAFAGTPYPIDPMLTAELLGFEGPMENSMDAVTSRDVCLEALAVASSVAVTLSALAEDLILFTNRGFIDLDDDYASTSSIMPQKKNPDSLELVRATSGDALGAQTAVATMLKGLPRAYNRDLQSVTPHLLTGIDSVTTATDVAAGGVSTSTWYPAVLESSVSEGLNTATDVADFLAIQGVPFRTAHAIVAEAAAAAEGDMTTFVSGLLEATTSLELSLEVETIEEYLSAVSSVNRRDSHGGPAPRAVRTQLTQVTATLDEHHHMLDTHREGLERASTRLESEVARYA